MPTYAFSTYLKMNSNSRFDIVRYESNTAHELKSNALVPALFIIFMNQFFSADDTSVHLFGLMVWCVCVCVFGF